MRGFGLHECGEVVAGDKADFRAAAGNGGERIGLFADEAGDSEDEPAVAQEEKCSRCAPGSMERVPRL